MHWKIQKVLNSPEHVYVIKKQKIIPAINYMQAVWKYYCAIWPTEEKITAYKKRTAHLQEHDTSQLLSSQFPFSIKRFQVETGGQLPAKKMLHMVQYILQKIMKTVRFSSKLLRPEKGTKKKKNSLVKLAVWTEGFSMSDPVFGTAFSSSQHLPSQFKVYKLNHSAFP